MGNYKNMLFFRRIDDAAQQECRQALDACRRWGLGWCTEQDGSTTAVSVGGWLGPPYLPGWRPVVTWGPRARCTCDSSAG